MNINGNAMKSVKAMLVVGTVLAASTSLVQGQTITYNGNVPQTFSVLNTSNAAVSYTDSVVFQNAIGSGTLRELTEDVRLRSNDLYKLSAQVTTNTGIAAAAATAEGITGQAIKLGDIAFGISNVDKSGNSVVNGGGTPTRTDTIVTGYTYASPTVTDGRVVMAASPAGKSLNDIQAANIQILSGTRISASGDNSADDNYLLVTLKAGYVPAYFTVGNFTVVVTLTIASNA